MSFQGSAFLAMWHDITAEGESEYNLWHTREHMPERVGIPGFLVGRRYVDWSLGKYRYLTTYEGESMGVFASEPYLARLNAPTEWSIRIQPHFRNFIRTACQTVATTGRGVGGAMLTARVDFADAGAGKSVFGACGAQIAERIGVLDGVTGVHVGIAEPSVTSIKTAETELKSHAGEAIIDGVVLVEGIGRCELQAIVPRVEALLTPFMGVAATSCAVYDLAYLLASEEPPDVP